MKTTPVRGMKDVLPAEMALREYVLNIIKETYRSFGFCAIDTPALENIENLCCNQGGENEKLIFKVLKRGDKLDLSNVTTENDLVDCGLRYDLTVPLARFYSNNREQLPSPFKALQIGNVWRADRPQKGRFRQFVQCDIDILGEAGSLAEIELILATTTCLTKLGFADYTVKVGDRRLLKAMAQYAGFAADKCDEVFIILDKLDKIGVDGVRQELIDGGFSCDSVDKYISLFSNGCVGDTCHFVLGDKLSGESIDSIVDNLDNILTTVKSVKPEVNIVYDASLVRGMGYYTGTIFEISIVGFGGAIAGGGRYDEMIGKYTKLDTCACGFSIGFERIITILSDNGFAVDCNGDSTAILIDKSVPASKYADIMAKANQDRACGKRVLVVQRKKNVRLQKDTLTNEGYREFVEYFGDK